MAPSRLALRLRKFVLPVYQEAVRRSPELSYLFLEITQRCDLACLHCGSDCTRSSRVEDLPAGAILRTLEAIARVYDPHRIMVAITGGEPLLYPGVFDLGRRIYETGFPWGMVTNGWNWTDAHLEAAQKARLHAVTVSLDGLEAEHDWLRGVPGSFQRAASTLRRLVAADFVKAMDVITCVNRRSLSRLSEMRDLLLEWGVKQWRLFIISPIGRAVRTPELFLTPEEYQSLLRQILQFRQAGGISVALSESGYLGQRLERRVRDHDHFCLAGIKIAGIMANGDILACPNIPRHFSQGNIFLEPFIDVWEQRFEPFRQRDWMRVGLCRSCSEWPWCRGGSFHLRDPRTRETRLCHFHHFELESPGNTS